MFGLILSLSMLAPGQCAGGSCGASAAPAGLVFAPVRRLVMAAPVRRVIAAAPVRTFFANGGFFRRGRCN